MRKKELQRILFLIIGGFSFMGILFHKWSSDIGSEPTVNYFFFFSFPSFFSSFFFIHPFFSIIIFHITLIYFSLFHLKNNFLTLWLLIFFMLILLFTFCFSLLFSFCASFFSSLNFFFHCFHFFHFIFSKTTILLLFFDFDFDN
mgnify:CR=1 FL=1